MYDVITVGSSTVDAFADSESELIKIKTSCGEEELIAYPCGSKILIKRLSFTTGGGGTNTAVALSRLGLKTAYLGKIGNDNNAEIICDVLKKENIEFVGVRGIGVSGYSVVLKSLEDDRSILAYKGINNNLKFSQINLDKIKAKWFYFSSMMGESFKTLESLAEYGKKNGIKITFNPSNYLAEKGAHFINNIMQRTDLLVLNREEAELLVGKWPAKDLILRLMQLGPKSVVVTDGKNGAYTVDENKFYHILTSGLKPIETTGAGDSFAASFLAGIIKKNDLKFALNLAQTNAESVIMNPGAKNGLLTFNEALERMKKVNHKIEIKNI